MNNEIIRRFPIGAEITPQGVHFRVWAPECKKIEVFLFETETLISLKSEKNGYFSGFAKIKEGALYQFCLDGQKHFLADPASRFQPYGPSGPSQIINPHTFKWTDKNWKGIEKDQVILYELHVGTFTPHGTWRSAMEKLVYLADLGITMIEMMPINEFPGRFNWGYDGVNLFAPTHNYGNPDDLRAFINEAHHLGVGVILDVVYNHFGPEGNFLKKFARNFFQEKETEWGEAINFDGKESRNVRDFYIANAGYWIEEFHFDGLRIDACHAIHDKSSPHIIAEITAEVRKKGGAKNTFITGENESQEIKFVIPQNEGGYGLDAIWNEDFHHTATVRLTGRSEAYYHDYLGKAQEFVSSAKYGFLYQGQWYGWQKKRRGSPCLGFKATSFVNFLQNHDQVANFPGSCRINQATSPALFRVFSALLFLMPQIPLLFQGQEFAATTPFYYFSEQSPEIAEKVFKGRIQFMEQFESIKTESKLIIPQPEKEETFLKSKLNWEELESHAHTFKLYKDLISLKKTDPVFKDAHELPIDGAAISDDVFLLRYFSTKGDCLILVNLGRDIFLDPIPYPLLAPPLDKRWQLYWTTEKICYGGFGYREIPLYGNWWLTGLSVMLFKPAKRENINITR